MLTNIREIGAYSSRNASKGALIQELYQVVTSVKAYNREHIRRFIIDENGLNKSTYENRRVIYNRLFHRYFMVCPGWVGQSLALAANNGIQSPEFLSLAYLYFVLRDRLSYDFVVSVLWKKWANGEQTVSPGDFIRFFGQIEESRPEVKIWREKTRNKIASIDLSAFRDFGLLKGKVQKTIQRLPVSNETVFHLLSILWAEGKRGRAIIEAEDWRIFLWGESDVASALNRIAQLGWIRFERGGQTVMLDLVRLPEVEDGC